MGDGNGKERGQENRLIGGFAGGSDGRHQLTKDGDDKRNEQ